MVGIKRVDFSNIDATGVSAGQQAVYIAANSRFEFVAADYAAAPAGPSGPSAPIVIQGQTSTTYGGGQLASGSPNQGLIMEKLPFSSDTPTTDIGEISSSIFATGTMSSETDGYYGGGPAYNPNTADWKFYKKSFASSSGSASLETTEFTNPLHGYSWGLNADPANGFWFGRGTTNNGKFSYSSDSFASQGWVSAEPNIQLWAATASSSTHGYNFAGSPGVSPYSPNYGAIRKFTFATSGSYTWIGDLSTGRYTGGGIQSDTHGYGYGGMNRVPGNWDSVETIEKFPFSSDVGGALTGNLLVPYGAYTNVGHSGSTTHGYSAGGSGSPTDGGTPSYHGKIDKFPFSSDSNSTDVGDLIAVARSTSATSV